MNTLQHVKPYICLQQWNNLCHSGTRAFHTNRKAFTFFVAVTYSLAPPNVNTFPIYVHDSNTGMGVQLEL